jgi:protein-disulfide isomerase/type II secretory pathway component PulC
MLRKHTVTKVCLILHNDFLWSKPLLRPVTSFALFLIAAILLGGVSGCDGSSTDSGAKGASERDVAPVLANSDESADDILGRAGNAEIRRSEVESPIALALYDIEMQRYRLLRQSVEVAALRRLDESGNVLRIAELNLEPPMPPRVSVGADPARVRPATNAPVTVLTFCNFESPHCVRLQRMLDQVLPLFEDAVRHAVRHFELPFHRNAELAGEAAHCALDQRAYWRYHDLLLAGSGPLSRERLDAAARAAGLDMGLFAECLDLETHAAALAADAEAALELAIDNVPAIFVNGLYAGNSADAAQLVWLIESELARLGVPSPRQVATAKPSTAPVLLTAALHSTHPGQGLALLAPAVAPERTGMFREGEAISHAIVLRRVTRTGIEISHNGEIEWLGFGERQAVVSDDQQPSVPAERMIRPHRAVPVTLSRDEVLVRLTDRVGLEAVLKIVPMKAGDYHQLRVTEIRPGSLYELLGLEAGDVILGVNEQPVHEADNPLWDALESEGEVRVRVMRRGGLARHYTYRFDD